MQMQLINTALSAEQIETLLDKLKTDAITAHRPFTDDELRGAYDILRLIVSAQVTYGLLMSGDITSRQLSWSRFLTTRLTGLPIVRPCRTPERISTSSFSICIRPPRP